MSDLIKISDAMKNARKIVIKIGSNTLAKADGTTNIEFMQGFAEQCKSLIDSGKQIVLVSSGAQVSGLATIHNWARKRDVHYRQALCAIGQVELMNQWRKAFAKQDLHIGQLLLTKEDFEDDHRTLNMRNTIFTLVDEGVIQIINENEIPEHLRLQALNRKIGVVKNPEEYIAEANKGLKLYRKSAHKAFIKNLSKFKKGIIKEMLFDFIKRRAKRWK